MRYTVWQWSRLGRWADKSARPELVEGRAVGCSWFDRLTTSVGTDVGAQQTRPLPSAEGTAFWRRHRNDQNNWMALTASGRTRSWIAAVPGFSFPV